jgi:hypothetical protein
MLTPGYAIPWVDHFPVGNTPAVCLTQGLPPEKKGNILILGCGDLRHILFTTYCDGKMHPEKRRDSVLTSCPESRQMDITCCDSETTIIGQSLPIPL